MRTKLIQAHCSIVSNERTGLVPFLILEVSQEAFIELVFPCAPIIQKLELIANIQQQIKVSKYALTRQMSTMH